MAKLFATLVLILALGASLLLAEPAAFTPWELSRPIVQYDRYMLTNPDNLAKVKTAGNLAGWQKQNDWFGIAGWFEYDLIVPSDGWYELSVQPDAGNQEYVFDGVVSVNSGVGANVGNFWLTGGKHTLRIQRFIWTGLSPVRGFTLRASAPALSKRLRVTVSGERNILSTRDQLTLSVESGALAAPVAIAVTVTNTVTRQVVGTYPATLPAADGLTKTAVSVPCPAEGSFLATVTCDAAPISPQDVRPIPFTVIDATPLPRTGGELKTTLLSEIDCVTTPPDYVKGGDTRVVSKPFGKYRESGDVGFRQFQNATNPSWFAYKITVPEAQKPYLVRVDYPDDVKRTYCIAVRDRSPGAYPIAGGVDSGGEFALTDSMLTHDLLVWPNSTDLRLLFIVPITGYRAAAAKIRVYAVDEAFPLPKMPAGGRHFSNWYEEGTNFAATYGAPDGSLRGGIIAADRWARAIAYMGGDTLIPTVSVYQMCLYPSRFNQTFADSSSPDMVRAMLLKCEKYSLGLIGEFHPEVRELLWPYAGQADPKPNESVSSDGKSQGRPFSPLYPANREWFLGMLGEFADRYKDSPAFKGVSLRLMTWVNPGLNNFASLDWGYDDYTVGLFSKETGTQIPVDATDPRRFNKRYTWLMANAKEAWMSWRCLKIAELHTQIRDRVRQARPDLKVYLPIFAGFPNDLREAGLDVKLLSAIDGLVLENAYHGYGRRGNTEMENQEIRDDLISPARLNALATPNAPSNYLFGSGYFEAIESVAIPEDMGYPANTKRNWMSGVVNPSGRSGIERYSLALAEGDALLLGDGGNGYTVGQPILREFTREYRSLPEARFSARQDARDPVAVWELARQNDFLFYAVNRERYAITITLQLSGATAVKRLASGDNVPAPRGSLAITLQPFELRTFLAPAGTKIVRVTTAIPSNELALVTRQVTWLEKLAADAGANRLQPSLDAKQFATLKALASEARVALTAGQTWHARTMMDCHELLGIYQKTAHFPPASSFTYDLQGAKAPWAYNKMLTQSYPQVALKTPSGIAEFMQGKVTLARQAELGDKPLLTWPNGAVQWRAPFTLKAPQQFRLWVRLAVGPSFSPVTVTDSRGKVIALIPENGEVGLQVAASAEPILLTPETATLTLTASGPGAPYLEQACFEPLFTDLLPKLRFVGYFPNPGNSNWTTALAPELPGGMAATATYDGTNGVTAGPVAWKPFPPALINAQAHVAQCPPGPLAAGVIAYAHATVTAPSARQAKLCFMGADQVRIAVNGEWVFDSVQKKANIWWFNGLTEVPITLRQGANDVLIKMANRTGTDNNDWKLIYVQPYLSMDPDVVVTP
ncbi:MAG TPA: hypothetical protein VGL77_07220 [Armatimonadota bacterium]|jgi:hypothetical protein